MISRNPMEDVDVYAEAALKLYLQLPETPLKASSTDRRTAEALHARGISLATIESALLLASVRRQTLKTSGLATPLAYTFPGLLSPGH